MDRCASTVLQTATVSRQDAMGNVERWVHRHFGSDDPKTSVAERKDHFRAAENIRRRLSSIFKDASSYSIFYVVYEIEKLDIYSVRKIEVVVDFIVEQAVKSPFDAALHGMISMHLSKVEVSDEKSNRKQFGTLLVKRCQALFKKGPLGSAERMARKMAIDCCEDPTTKKTMETTLIVYDENEREKYGGLMRFIGKNELYRHGLLTDKCLANCLDALLDRKDAESLEYSCVLLGVVRYSFKGDLAPVIGKMRGVAATTTDVSARVRSTIDDLKQIRH